MRGKPRDGDRGESGGVEYGALRQRYTVPLFGETILTRATIEVNCTSSWRK